MSHCHWPTETVTRTCHIAIHQLKQPGRCRIATDQLKQLLEDVTLPITSWNSLLEDVILPFTSWNSYWKMSHCHSPAETVNRRCHAATQQVIQLPVLKDVTLPFTSWNSYWKMSHCTPQLKQLLENATLTFTSWNSYWKMSYCHSPAETVTGRCHTAIHQLKQLLEDIILPLTGWNSYWKMSHYHWPAETVYWKMSHCHSPDETVTGRCHTASDQLKQLLEDVTLPLTGWNSYWKMSHCHSPDETVTGICTFHGIKISHWHSPMIEGSSKHGKRLHVDEHTYYILYQTRIIVGRHIKMQEKLAYKIVLKSSEKLHVYVYRLKWWHENGLKKWLSDMKCWSTISISTR